MVAEATIMIAFIDTDNIIVEPAMQGLSVQADYHCGNQERMRTLLVSSLISKFENTSILLDVSHGKLRVMSECQ
jgi:ABC-type uncharacterized transport system auxiliary subunit